MGDGENAFALDASDVAFDVFRLRARGGRDADRFALNYDNVAVTDSLTQTISAGRGADEIALIMNQVSINSSVVTKLKGDAGADVITAMVTGVHVAADGSFRLSLEGKHGADRLRADVTDLLLDGALELMLKGGHDNDTAAAVVHADDRSRGTIKKAEVKGDQDDDDLELALFGPRGLKLKKALLDGGKGFDRCLATPNVKVIHCEANNSPPVLSPIGNQTIPHAGGNITLSATDPDQGDVRTFSATAETLEFTLDQQLGLFFTGSYYENLYGQGEKWMLGSGGKSYFILPNGDFHEWDNTPRSATGPLIATLSPNVHADPTLLHDA